MSPKTVRKAVIPAAGLGTRFLPVTRSQPKELMPILGKPLIQYVVEEAVSAGLDTIILVVSPRKAALEQYFQTESELEHWLLARGKNREAEQLRMVSSLAKVCSVVQAEPLGLGHAIGCARAAVGDEPFAVLLPDVLFDSHTPCIAQLLQVFTSQGAAVIGMKEIEARDSRRYGIVSARPVATAPGASVLMQVDAVVEKPAPEDAPSRYGIIGRYILPPAIFTCLDQVPPDARGEIQLAPALTSYARHCPLLALQVEGMEYDAGDRLGFVKATVELALRDAELGPSFRHYLAELHRRDE